MADLDDYLIQLKKKLNKALDHLAYSFQKIQTLPVDPNLLDEENLEVWESFTMRFSRVADLFLSKYIRTRLLIADPGFNGSFRDTLNFAEKLGIIENSETWLEIRGLRNVTVHEYTDEDLVGFFSAIKQRAPLLLALKEKI